MCVAVYMAPEIFDRDYYWEADMWSLGIMLYQLYARRFPYWKTYEECRYVAEPCMCLLWRGCPALSTCGANSYEARRCAITHTSLRLPSAFHLTLCVRGGKAGGK